MKRAAAKDLLIEIGTEELPAHYVPPALKQLEELVPKLFAEARIAHGRVRLYGSPRRLAIFLDAVAARQTRETRTVRGPAKSASFDAAGKPTPALQGFLRKHHAAVAAVAWIADYAQLTLHESTASVTEVLMTLVPALIARISFPKTMRWDDSGLMFARPIRWLVVLYGAKAVRVTVGSLTSGVVTYGHPARGRRSIVVKSPARYAAQLKAAGVLVDQAARGALIKRLITDAARTQGGVIAAAALEHGLLEEVTFLTEDPQILIGVCDQKLLMLPPEVIVASMSKHQRVFAVTSAKGDRLLPSFVAVLDGTPTQPARVRQFAERILTARLSDALDFWTQDTATPLVAKVAQLKGIVFHEQLGTMYDKTQRVVALCAWLIEQSRDPVGGQEQITSQVLRAATLAKADLVTTMVKEFPSLQGIVGGHYARVSGEDDAVVKAIGKHYDPLGNPVAEWIALADWFDTLTGYFGIGIEPTGSQDPFGLRRCALGVVQILQRTRMPLSIAEMTQQCLKAWGPRLSVPPARLTARVESFLKERLASDVNLKEWVGDVRYDVVRAVLSSACDDVRATLLRMKELGQMDGSESFAQAASVVERTANILRGVNDAPDAVDTSKFVEPLERKLWEVYNNTSSTIEQLINARQYRAATQLYGKTFAGPIHEFFDRVLVNVPDQAVRRNRLALLWKVNRLYAANVADLSKVVIETRAAKRESPVQASGRRSVNH